MSEFKEQFIEVVDKTIVSINMDNDVLDFIDSLKNKYRLTRSCLINFIIREYSKYMANEKGEK